MMHRRCGAFLAPLALMVVYVLHRTIDSTLRVFAQDTARWSRGPANDGKSDETKADGKSSIFPRALELWRRGVPLASAYNFTCPSTLASGSSPFDLADRLEGEELRDAISRELDSSSRATKQQQCSCKNRGATTNQQSCCERCIFWSHKQGAALVKDLFGEYTSSSANIQLADFEGNTGTWIDWANRHILRNTNIDYRDVLVLRNLKDSLLSGYLYHKSGKECWEDWYGRHQLDKASPFTRDWQRFISTNSTKAAPQVQYPTICHYLSNQTEEVGMRAYIEWVFHAYYEGPYTQWALSQGLDCPAVQERTKTVCFEHLTNYQQSTTIDSVLRFLSNGTFMEPRQMESGNAKKDPYKGGHATSKDPAVRERLLRVIDDVDRKYFHGDIEWLAGKLPC